MRLLVLFIVNAVAFYLIARYVPGFNHDVGVRTALVAALIFGIVNAVIGPILRFITFPITWITHGLFSIVVNFILFWLTVLIAPHLRVTGEISPWLAYLIGAVIMMLVSTILQQGWKSEAESAWGAFVRSQRVQRTGAVRSF